MNSGATALIVILATLVVYIASVWTHKKFNYTFTLPVILSSFAIIVVLIAFHIPYKTFMIGGQWINHLLGPAVVALAYPMYQYRETLKKVVLPVLAGTCIGAVIGITSGLLLAKWAGFSDLIIYSLVPKSVTTPVAMAISSTIGGATPLSAVFVMIAGIGGVFMSRLILRFGRIHHYLGRGVGLGCASHAIGTATAMESSELEGSISTIAMVTSAVVVSVIAPWLTLLLM